MDITTLPVTRRTLGGVDYFLLWAGVAVSLAEIWAGGFLAPMGLWAGLAAIVLGHLIGNTLMAGCGMLGSDHGVMAMTSLRPSFGIRGSVLPAVLNIIQLVGWAAIMLIISGHAGAMLATFAPVPSSERFWIVLIGLGTLFWALFTEKPVWKTLQNTAVIGLLIVVCLMSVVSFKEIGVAAAVDRPVTMRFMTGLDLVIAMPISFMPLVADYARFAKSTKTSFWNTWWGYFLVSSWMYVLGLVATLITGETDPGMLILRTMGSLGLAVPALILVVFSTITSDFANLYSSTCSALNISERIKPKTVIWISGILSILVALVFPMAKYESFLLFIGAMFVPVLGIVMTDYFLIRKRTMEIDELDRPEGPYWYFKGVNRAAILSWIAGFGVFQGLAAIQSPLGSSLPSILAAGIVYYLCMFRSTRYQV
jgi:putative hydroxymethylpyrimidine transporter CytX